MNNPSWNIGIFTKIDNFTAECIECKKNGPITQLNSITRPNHINYTAQLHNQNTKLQHTWIKNKQ